MATDFEICERAVAEAILPGRPMRELVREARAGLKEGKDFVLKRKTAMYSVEGVRRLTGLLVWAPEDAVEVVPPVLPPKRAVLRVTRVYPGNRCYMDAAMKGVKEGQRIRCRDTRLFLPGMEMECVEAGGGLWDFTGRLPRARGRW